MAVLTPIEVSKEDLPITNVSGTVKRRARVFFRYNGSVADTYDLRSAIPSVIIEDIRTSSETNVVSVGTAFLSWAYQSGGTSVVSVMVATGTATGIILVTY